MTVSEWEDTFDDYINYTPDDEIEEEIYDPIFEFCDEHLMNLSLEK